MASQYKYDNKNRFSSGYTEYAKNSTNENQSVESCPSACLCKFLYQRSSYDTALLNSYRDNKALNFPVVGNLPGWSV